MNKEEKKQIAELTKTQAELVKTQQELLEWVRQRPPAPVLFSADCESCGKATVHVSHIAGEIPGGNTSIVSEISSASWPLSSPTKPLRTCLQCGHTEYKN